MSEFHKPAVERIETGMSYDPATIMLIFEELLEQAQNHQPGTNHFTAMFIDEEDEFVPGTYVPEIWFVLRKVVDDDECEAVQQELR